MVQNKTKHEIVNFVSEIAGNGLDLMLNIFTSQLIPEISTLFLT